MTEYKLFEGDIAEVSTWGFHEDRPRAPHWEQEVHRARMEQALTYIIGARSLKGTEAAVLIDLGCGDGGLIQQIEARWPSLFSCIGYDFQPSNREGWRERGLFNMHARDFVGQWKTIPDADIYVATEVLEHLSRPHSLLQKIHARDAQLVCSSPFTETNVSHDECHAWAWDEIGYRAMIEAAGFEVKSQTTVGMFQVVWAVPR